MKYLFITLLISKVSLAYEFANFNDGYSKEDTDRIYRFLEENKMLYTLKLLNGEKIESKKFTCKDDAELCQIQKARQFFKEGKYQLAEDLYADIPNRSFYWPSVLLERAWVNYYLKNYNRTLGLLSTFKFPLLKVFYGSEITYLTALSYFRLCYWGDAYLIIDDFKKNELTQIEDLKKTLQSGEKKSDILNNWFNTLKRTAYFSTTALELMGLENERAQLSMASKHVLHDIILRRLDTQVKARRDALNRYFNLYLKNKLDNNALYNEQVEILELEVLSITRKTQYQRQEKLGRLVGGYEYLPRTRFQYFWDFPANNDAEFWADELGNYVFALKSQCEAQ